MNLDELQRVAEAATPGPWEAYTNCPGECCWLIRQPDPGDDTFSEDVTCPEASKEDAAHIAAFSPDLALKLIAIARAAKDHIESLDAYDKTLVPINRSRGTAAALRKSLEGVSL